MYTSKKVCCLICKKEYSTKGIHTHYMRSHGSDEERSKFPNKTRTKESYIEGAKKISATFKYKRELNYKPPEEKQCPKCNKIHVKLGKFCSRSCANSRGPRSEEFKQKVGNKLRGKSYKKYYFKICRICGDEFLHKNRNKKNCLKCGTKRLKSGLTNSVSDYRKQCEFNFNLKDYPNEFDFSLIEKFGWYLPANRGNNLNGVSRDHMISIKYGFENNIDPKIISHPANCQLLRHNDNVSKGFKNSITLEQLLNKIEMWDNKYK